MRNEIIYLLLSSFLYSFALILLYYIFYDLKFNKKIVYEIYIFFVITSIFEILKLNIEIRLAIISILSICLLYFYHKIDFVKTILVLIVIFFSTILLDLVQNLVLYYFDYFDYYLEYKYVNYNGYLSMFILKGLSIVIFVLVGYIGKMLIDINLVKRNLTIYFVGAFSFMSILVYGKIFVLYNRYKVGYIYSKDFYRFVILLNVMLLIYPVFMVMLYYMVSIISKKNVTLKSNYDNKVNALIEEYRISHNFNNNMLIIKSLLENERYDEALLYIKENQVY